MPGPALVVTSARFVDIAGALIRNANQDRSAAVPYGHVTSNDSIVVYKMNDTAIYGVVRLWTTGSISVDPGDCNVTVTGACRQALPRPTAAPNSRRVVRTSADAQAGVARRTTDGP